MESKKQSAAAFNALPDVLASQIYEYSSPDTFAHLALVSRGVCRVSSRYRKSNRYALRTITRTLNHTLNHKIVKFIREKFTDFLARPIRVELMQTAIAVGRVLANVVLYGSIKGEYVGDDITDGSIIRAARYCAVGCDNLELLWWAAQREGDPYSISLFRDTTPKPDETEQLYLAFITFYTGGLKSFRRIDNRAGREYIKKFTCESPQSTWMVLRHASPAYKLEDIFKRIRCIALNNSLLGFLDGVPVGSRDWAVLGPDTIVTIAKAIIMKMKYTAFTEILGISKCIGAPIEYSDQLMYEAVQHQKANGTL